MAMYQVAGKRLTYAQLTGKDTDSVCHSEAGTGQEDVLALFLPTTELGRSDESNTQYLVPVESLAGDNSQTLLCTSIPL